MSRRRTLHEKQWLVVSTIAMVIVISVESLVGIFANDFYANESISWELQTGGQDVMNLLIIVPLLIVCVTSIHFNKKVAWLVWAGTIVYTSYTFLIYCFDVHFNRLFLLYCLTLCLSAFMLFFFIASYLRNEISRVALHHYPFRWTGVYFLLTSVLFTIAWLANILPAVVNNTVPEEIIVSRLPTNPVQVLDLSFILPLIFFTGILLLRRQKLAYQLAPIILVFIVLMELTIALLTSIMTTQGQEGSFILAGSMIGLALVGVLLFLKGLQALAYETRQ